MQPLPHTRSCFVCGESNPIGLNLRFLADGPLVRATFVPRVEHAGFKTVIHGGITATVLDEVMVWACAVATRQFAYCAEMNVRYLSPIAPGTTVHLVGEMVANRKGRIFEARGTAQDAAGRKFAESTGKYLPIKDASAVAFAADFVGNAGWFKTS